MIHAHHEDIDQLIKEIEHIKINVNDPYLGPVFWEQAMKEFIDRDAIQLVNLLSELRRLRDQAVNK